MRSFEDLFEKLKCVRCGSRGRLTPYIISKVVDSQVVSRRRRSTTYMNTISQIKLPICLNCNLEFQKWKKFKSKNKYSYGGAVGFSIVTVLVFFLAINNNNSSLFYVVPLLFLPIGIFLTHAILISYTSSKLENNPKHSMKFIKKEAYVKPMNSFSWIRYPLWIETTLKDSMTEDIERVFKSSSSPGDMKMYYEYCPKCNTKLDEENKFCVECGEPLN